MSSSSSMLVLFETACGYGLFERLESDEIGSGNIESISAAMQDLSKFGRVVKLQAFVPFKNAAEALQNMNDVSEGIVSDTLESFLEMNLPDSEKKRKRILLGVSDKTLAGNIKSSFGVNCVSDETVAEVIRGLRLFADTILVQHLHSTAPSSVTGSLGDVERAQLGLGHSYSRAKVKFNVHRSDNMILQASALLDQMDKDINTFFMRLKEWYSWHFPEFARIVAEPKLYARLVLIIGDKESLTEESVSVMEEALISLGEDVSDATRISQSILEASRASMGTDMSPIDMINIKAFAQRVLSLSEYRTKLHEYLTEKMDLVAPNLSALIGEIVGARLISHAGSLTNLSKYPASTVQILGAEKALFRALKTKGKTPKYGLIYHASFIGRAGAKNKGRISRYLSNKCAIASRIDCFSDEPTRRYGDAMKGQVEERLSFYEHQGDESDTTALRKNSEVMAKVAAKVAKDIRKRAKETENDQEEDSQETPKKKSKKSSKKSASVEEEETKEDDSQTIAVDQDAKDKKKKKKSSK